MSDYVKKRRSYTLSEKASVLNDLENSGYTVEKFAKIINVPKKTLYKWNENKNTILSKNLSKPKLKKVGSGRKTILSNETEKELLEWIVDIRTEGLPLSGDLIKSRARYLTKGYELYDNYKFTDGWLYKFLNRHELILRKNSSKIVSMTKEDILIISNFIEMINSEIINGNYYSVINIDESGIYYDQSINYTYEKKGTKRVEIITTGREKQRVTAIFGIDYYNAIKIKPTIILKGKTNRSLKGIPEYDDCNIAFQTNAWCNGQIFNSFLSQLPKDKKILIICDNFRGHYTDDVINFIKNEYPLINYVLLPKNTTSLLQPLDVGINKPVKNYIKNKYISWLIDQYEKSGSILNLNKSNRNLLLIDWIRNSWKNINNENIIKSFNKCGYGQDDKIIPLWKIFFRMNKK